jgi:hypothetical protein
LEYIIVIVIGIVIGILFQRAYSYFTKPPRPKPVHEIFETKPKSNNDVSPITIGLFILFCLFAGIVVINI